MILPRKNSHLRIKRNLTIHQIPPKPLNAHLDKHPLWTPPFPHLLHPILRSKLIQQNLQIPKRRDRAPQRVLQHLEIQPLAAASSPLRAYQPLQVAQHGVLIRQVILERGDVRGCLFDGAEGREDGV